MAIGLLRSALVTVRVVLVAALVLLGLACGRPARAQDAASLRFGAEGFTLENGMQVVVIPNHRVHAVTQMVWYKVGAADEPRGVSGIAHFLEHLMFKGTKEVPPGMFSRLVAQNGGRGNAFTGEDYTAFHQTVSADRLELVMRLEADRMNGLELSDAVVLPERDVIIEERRSRIDNNPAALLDEQMRTAIYLNHPYRIPTIGWEHEMAQLSTADALAFYRTWYHPNNAVLVVSGDVETDAVRRLAEKYYGPLPAQAVPSRLRVTEPPRVASTELEFRSPQVAQANWTRSFIAPSYTGGETKYAYALQVLAEIVGGGATSRLYRSLVVEQKLALNAGAFYDPGPLDLSTFGFFVSPRAGVDIAQLETAMTAQIAALLEKGVTAEEVTRAQSRMQAEEVYERDSLSGPANIFGAALAVGRTIDDVEAWPARIGKVTAEEVDEAAKFVIKNRDAVTGVLLPEHGSGTIAEEGPPTPFSPGR
ncbi:MAG: insulinase family protein, partial [Alphaproteobacteria bacterium]|nr:insulinase family protein [Alphaproteobacteria bacterium]